MNGWLKQGKKTINKTNSARFPAPPFQQQQQPFPGLAGKMQPRPDHGEDSYQGSGRLNGRKVLITALLQIVGGDKLIIPFC
ncbi:MULTISPECIES: hypothetical protein [Enterobacteriaceae]|uniref:hypothetical protein n=1 Tax=Enterobacteriaceae TaxID=543 RepID=UPI0036066D91